MADSTSAPGHPVIFLIGYRGTGKTTVARLLAERLGWTWIDADEMLEDRYGKSIRQIFEEEGESAFRDKETAVLKDLCQRRQCVIATGGGVILRPENCELLRASGLVVWLIADAPTIWQRLQQDITTQEHRPALTVGGLTEIEELLRTRETWYRDTADCLIDTVGRPPEEVASAILDQLRMFNV